MKRKSTDVSQKDFWCGTCQSNNLALVYNRLGEYNKAKELHQKTLMIREKMFGDDHADVATSYNNLASVCNSL